MKKTFDTFYIIFLQVGTYKGMLVAIKKLKKERVILSRDDLLELKVVRFSHFSGIFPSFIFV